jgi:hypothetical protein
MGLTEGLSVLFFFSSSGSLLPALLIIHNNSLRHTYHGTVIVRGIEHRHHHRALSGPVRMPGYG